MPDDGGKFFARAFAKFSGRGRSSATVCVQLKDRQVTAVVVILLCALTVARLVIAGSVGLSPDEAYYYLWSERLDWAYYSKGPGVALAIRLGTLLFGPTELGVRLLSPLLGLGSSVLLFLFTKRLYGAVAGAWAAALVSALPIFNVGSIVMTIDPLSIFFWIAAVYALWMALERSPRLAPGWWLLAGLLTGAGFLCKYTNAFLLLSAVLLLLVSRRHRPHLWRGGFLLMLLGFAPGLVPPWIWNMDRGWVTAGHLLERGGLSGGGSWSPADFFEYLAMHLGVYSPLLFIGMVIAAVAAVKAARNHFRPLFLLCFAAPIILFYFGLSLKQAGEANWTAPGFVTLGVLAAGHWSERIGRSAVVRGWALASILLGLAMTFVVLCSDLLRAAGLPWPYALDPGARLRGWKTAAEKLEALRRDFERDHPELGPVFLIANKYGTAAALGFYLPGRRAEGPGHPPVYTPESQAVTNQFAFWPRYDEHVLPDGEPLPRADEALDFTEEAGVNLFIGRTALFVTDDVSEDGRSPKSPHEVRRGFGRFARLGDIVVERHGQKIRVLRVFACYRYKGTDL